MIPKSNDKKQPLIDSGEPEQPPSLSGLAWRWIGTVIFCLAVWAVLSPLIYERFFSDLGHGGDGWGVVLFTVCIIVPLLLVSVSATRKVVVKTREQYLPPVVPDHLPAQEVPVRGSAMKCLSDRKKMRRAYLWKKSNSFADVFGAGLTLVLALIVSAALTIWFGIAVDLDLAGKHTESASWRADAVTGIYTAISWLVTFYVWRGVRRGVAVAKSLSYVAPVTPSTLPAEEVLVRGSVEPGAPQETLLRAAQGDVQTPPEELLRSHLP